MYGCLCIHVFMYIYISIYKNAVKGSNSHRYSPCPGGYPSIHS